MRTLETESDEELGPWALEIHDRTGQIPELQNHSGEGPDEGNRRSDFLSRALSALRYRNVRLPKGSNSQSPGL